MSNVGKAARADHAVSNQVSETMRDQPWVKPLARAGWVAKGVVYTLMGLTAFTIGRGNASDDEASPEGAVAQVISNPGGKFLLGLLALGLILYAAWRYLSLAMVRGMELKDWLERAGYLFSAVFYSILAYTAIRTLATDVQPEDSNTIEKLSQTMLESSLGRWVMLIGGVVAFAVGLYFIFDKGINKSFLEEISFAGASSEERKLVTYSGVIGWIGRGLVTAAVGFFIAKAAWEVDKDDARGFDRALRELATHDQGRYFVIFAGVALIAYGVFCIVSFRRQELKS